MQLLVLSVLLHTNVICFYAKIQLQMFQLYLCLQLSSTQTVSSHYTPSLLHIPKMMMNVMTTLQPIAKYSTFLSLLFSTPLLLLFFSTILLPPLAFVCAHSSALPFPLLFIIVFQLHSYGYEFQNLKNVQNFQQQTQTSFDGYPVFSRSWTSCSSHSSFHLLTVF